MYNASAASAVSRSSLRDFSLSLGTLIAFQLALVGVFSRISNMIYLNLCEVCVQRGRESEREGKLIVINALETRKITCENCLIKSASFTRDSLALTCV